MHGASNYKFLRICNIGGLHRFLLLLRDSRKTEKIDSTNSY